MGIQAHGAENSEFEIRKAYIVVADGALPYFWQNRSIEGVDPSESIEMYKRACRDYRRGNRLAAERWARAAKHLGRALLAEAKIAYLKEHSADLPVFEEAPMDLSTVTTQKETAEDLLASVSVAPPEGFGEMPEAMDRYLRRARWHLEAFERDGSELDLARAEMIRAAHEYSRVLEIMVLAYEAEAGPESKSA